MKDERQQPGVTGRSAKKLALLALLGLLAACSSGTDTGPRFAQVSQLGDTYDDHAPYVVWATVRPGARPVRHVRLYYTPLGGVDFQSTDMSTFSGNSWQGSMPAQPAGTDMLYFVRAEEADPSVYATYPPEQKPANYLRFRVLIAGEQPIRTPGAIEVEAAPGADAGSADTAVDSAVGQPDVQGSDTQPLDIAPDIGLDIAPDVAPDSAPDTGPVFDSVDIGPPPDVDVKADFDNDYIPDWQDNCAKNKNADQLDSDSDGKGDVCDPDDDNDGAPDDQDNCSTVANPTQADLDKDGKGDACDKDIDGDKILNEKDDCPWVSNADQKDSDLDGLGDACDPVTGGADKDQDGVLDGKDNCTAVPNPDQKDADADGQGDVCDADIDGDGVPNAKDNCPLVSNPDQKDSGNGVGDACEAFDDKDGDGVADAKDNCPKVGNPGQSDLDGDGKGDACDKDKDEDGIVDTFDNCPAIANQDQKDTDGDGKGDVCDDEVLCGVGKPACPQGTQCYAPLCLTPPPCSTQAECKTGTFCYQGHCLPPQVVPSDFCAKDAQCPTGFVCQFGKCAPDKCKFTSDCPAGQKCLLGECLPNGVPVSQCQQNEQCGPKKQCLAGICIPAQCSQDAECNGNASCFKGFCIPLIGGVVPIPQIDCKSDADCPPLKILNQTLEMQCGAGVCLPKKVGGFTLPDLCTVDSDCGAGSHCLLAICAPEQCKTAAQCEADQACTFGLCTAKDQPLPQPGQCKTKADCPNGGSCIATACVPFNIPGGGGGPGGLEFCMQDGTCSKGKKCQFGVICL